MKRVFRIIVPILLALALLAGTAWYFLVYDRAFTKELLLTQARNFEANGRPELSAFLYDLAYRHSSQEDLVAIELADQYLKDGNHTKAEYTLSQAIAANPTAELYIALCDVYVQQDKLLDAVNMLDTIGDLDIWQQIQALRPEAPVFTPEPGFYSTYLTLELQDAPGTLYVSPDGDYPSISKDLYKDPVTLATGETVIYALRVGANGLISKLTINGYTVGGVIEPVVFADGAVEAAIREAIQVAEDLPLYTNDLWVVEDFIVPEDAQSLEDLKYLPYLKTLEIPQGAQGDLGVLAALNSLESLSLRGRKLSQEDMTLIASRQALTSLALPGCSVSSVAELASLTGLTYLNLNGNTVRNLEPLSGMTALKQLHLSDNALNTLEALRPLKSLEVLDVTGNSLTTLEPIYGLKATLRELYAGENKVSSVIGIHELRKLTHLDLSQNGLTDVKMLTALTELNQLDLSNNAIPTILGLETMAHLHILNVANNLITELPPFPEGSELVSIDFSNNQVALLDPLKGLEWLNTVNADYNPEIEDLLPLDSCQNLIKVNVYGTKVTEVSFLTAKSIIVNFDPTIDKD